MTKLPLLECTLTFLAASEGGRPIPFPSGSLRGNKYRPHLVVGDPNQRTATVVDGHGTEDYIGVAFHDGPEIAQSGAELVVVLTLSYYPNPMYEALRPGTTFTLREGGTIVGYGSVRRWLNQ